MKNYITFILCLGLCFGVCMDSLSQGADTTSSKLELFNEGGYVRGITPARAIGLVELGLGVASLIMAFRARRRSDNAQAKKAIIAGLTTTAFCIVHLIITAGAIFGSGSGKAGSIIAMILCLAGTSIALRTLRTQNG